MRTRTLLIAIGVLVVAGVLCLGAAAGGALAYFSLRSRPAQALGPVRWVEPRLTTSEAGILVAQVDADSPAAEAGIERGDILLEVNGEPVNRPVDLTLALEGLEAGDRVELKVQHGDEQNTLTATLVEKDGLPYLGLTPAGPPLGGEVFLRGAFAEGALITEVTAGSPADQAGLEEGDRILAVDGTEVGPDEGLSELIGAHQPGDSVTLDVSRPGEEPRDVQVELGEHPDQPGKAYLGVSFVPALPVRMPEELPFEGMPFQGKPIEIPELPEGISQAVVIGEIVSGSPAEEAGLQEKDFITQVDGQTVDSPEALAEAVQARQPGDTITLTVLHPGETEQEQVEVTLGEDPQEAGKAYLGISALGFIHIEREEK